ncbi:acyl-CoA carboxylase epsilon subunit [Microbacterium maritypicum]|uniref:Acyl-CoA carboxylase epsilon subunit n=2 Tax=Microbacterium maritypicum TaxID=33918 RepID=A0AAJ5VD89_MICMQ|nr:acyl-CoA carboxylase epsilon subunit [Microbacterium liquefaciens]UTT54206.1 acyl-CoA carboxylase subunit epsilon [Microbacterium liquefaciens]WEF22168.1 acyl-CoA carboxylase epsilon subunit [Microbacterium liquefaciens]
MTAQNAQDGTSAPEAPMLDITRGAATEEELAALIAVISEAYATEAAAAVADEPSVSAWTRTQRPLRRPLRRDIPWGRFSG